jgi:hypothetical protein
MVMRIENWEIALSRHLMAWRERKFEWGSSDCAQFAGQAIEAMTGENILAAYPYTDEESGNAVLAAAGGLEALAQLHLGEYHQQPKTMMRGDFVLMQLPLITCGIVDDTGMRIAAMGPAGLVRLPREAAWKIWSY